MLYWFWDMARDRCNCYFSFWAIFCCFTPLTAQKIKTWKKIWKKTSGYIIILHICTKIFDKMLYGSWDMVCDRRTDRCNCYFSFWAIFCCFTSLTAQKIKIWKKIWKKTPGYIIILHICTKIYDKNVVWFLRHGARRTDGQTDGRTVRQKKWHIEAGVSPKNIWNWELQLFPASIRNYKKLVFSCIHKKFWSRLSYQFFQQTQKLVFWGKYKKIFSGEGGLKTFFEENLIGWVCQVGLL